jgi:hypothetical protein
MAIELVLDASVSLAWFLKETPERAAWISPGGTISRDTTPCTSIWRGASGFLSLRSIMATGRRRKSTV